MEKLISRVSQVSWATPTQITREEVCGYNPTNPTNPTNNYINEKEVRKR